MPRPVTVIISDESDASSDGAIARQPEDDLSEFPTFDARQRAIIANALNVNADSAEKLIIKYGLSITRQSIRTLAGLNWLDDTIINFYMRLLVERSERRPASDGLPKVYAFNTFFLGRLTSGGQAAVRRWTRTTDLSAYDLLLVPVHVQDVHWALAIVDFRGRSIRYYDSIMRDEPKLLAMLAQYLVAEHRDKKAGAAFDVRDWLLESMLDIPQQRNQSDCGVFSCAMAETKTRNAPVGYSQANMPWMRMKKNSKN